MPYRALTEEQVWKNRGRAKAWRDAQIEVDPEFRIKHAKKMREFRRKHPKPEMTHMQEDALRARKAQNKRDQRARKKAAATGQVTPVQVKSTQRTSSRRRGEKPAEQLLPVRRRQAKVRDDSPVSRPMIVAMPFSRHPHARKLARELQSEMQKNKVLKMKLTKTDKKPLTFKNTPEKEAATLLSSVDVTPTQSRLNALIPLCATVDAVKKAPVAVKKSLFAKKVKRRGIAKSLACKLKISRDNIYHQKKGRKYQRKVIALSKRIRVNEFLRRSDNSYELPGKRDRVHGIGKFALSETMRNLYGKFQSENPAMIISFATFCNARQKRYVKLIQYTRRIVCLCQKHANIDLICRASKRLPLSANELCKMSDKGVQEKLATLPTKVNFRQWEKAEINHDGRTIMKVQLKDKSLSDKLFTTTVISMLQEFRPHCKRIKDIYMQLSTLKAKLTPNVEALVQLDYAENWAIKYQKEVGSNYYNNQQISILPMVVYYRNADGEFAHESFAGISDETLHTAPTSIAFIKALVTYLRAILSSLGIIHFVSDSPSSQFRNRTMCAVISKFPMMFKLEASWTWLESGHGKGPCDGIGGTIKKVADNIVKSGKVLRNASEFCSSLQERGIKSHIIQISREAIGRVRTNIGKWSIPAVPGIATKHSIVSVGGLTKVKDIPCYQDCCYEGGLFHPTCPGWQDAHKTTVGNMNEVGTSKSLRKGRAKTQVVAEGEPRAQTVKKPNKKEQVVVKGEPRAQTVKEPNKKEQVVVKGEPRAQTVKKPNKKEQVVVKGEPRAQTVKKPNKKVQVVVKGEPRAQTVKKPNKKEQVTGEKESGEQTGKEVKKKEQVTGEKDSGEQTGKEVKKKEQVTREKDSGEQTGKEVKKKEQVTREKDSGEQTGKEVKKKEQVTGEKDSGEQTGKEVKKKEQVTGEKESGEQTGKEVKKKEQVTREKESGEQTGKEVKKKEQVTGEKDSGEQTGKEGKKRIDVGRKYYHGNYIKVDEMGFRPLIKSFTHFPMIEEEGIYSQGSPFQRVVLPAKKKGDSFKSPTKVKRNYCEVCSVSFTSTVGEHLKGLQHRRSVGRSNYDSIPTMPLKVKSIMPEKGECVAALYDNDWYIGEVKERDDKGEIFISFMEKISETQFKWGRRDEIWVPLAQVLCKVKCPAGLKGNARSKIKYVGEEDRENIIFAFSKCNTSLTK